MIIGVCSHKGSPGVTTLATALTLAWPGEAILLEADPSGADLPFRLHPPGMQYLSPEPMVLSLALAARTSAASSDVTRYSQSTSLGLRVIPGPLKTEDRTAMRPMWALAAKQVQTWPGTVVVDLGRLQPGHESMDVATAADVLLLMTERSVGGLFHTREASIELARVLGERSGPRPTMGVVIRTGRRHHDAAVDELTAVLQAVGSPVPVAGWVADDPAGVADLLQGRNSPGLRKSALMRSVNELITRLHRTWALTSAAEDPPVAARSDLGPGASRGRAW